LVALLIHLIDYGTHLLYKRINEGWIRYPPSLITIHLILMQVFFMQALDALLQRVSASKLIDPAPDQQQREMIFSAALRAADHGRLRPWRFLVIEAEARNELGELFERVATEDDASLTPAARERFRNMPLRAPMIVVVIAKCTPHPKVPEIELLISAGAAAQNMITAAYALGIGAIWRTGELAYHLRVRDGLGLTEDERIVGYLYLGTPGVTMEPAPLVDYHDFFSAWPAR
jgi:nitroreductase